MNQTSTAGAAPEVPRDAGAELLHQMGRVRSLHDRRAADPQLRRELAVLARWQAARLAHTYRDLDAVPRNRAAVAFFLDDLYGPHDFSQRDADLERIAPLLMSMLPARVLSTVAAAVELNALTTELDIDMLAQMGPPAPDGRLVSVERWCEGYRRSGREADRRHQIALIGVVGHALPHYVEMPLLHGALRMMRIPARMAGFAEMHRFLEGGFDAFARLGDGAADFVETIRRRETELLERILAGDRAPFPEPALA